MSNIDNLGRFGEVTKDMKAAGGVDPYLADIRRGGRVEAGIPALAIGLLLGWGLPAWSRRRAAKAEAALRASIDCDTCADTGRVPWMVEADPNVYQESDADGTVPCPDCRAGRAQP